MASSSSSASALLPTTGPSVSCQPTDADTAWMLMATVLVLGMFPGVAFFEAGLLRRKNTTSILAQVFCGLAILSVMWLFFGFSLTFAPHSNGFIGDFRFVFFYDVSFTDCFNGGRIPTALYGTFQMMFACITPLLMTGAYAERLSWTPFVIFTPLWEVLVYYPVAHWMWSTEGWLYRQGALDFAGGIVIHTTAGVSALVVVWLLGRRHQFDKYHGEFPYSSLPNAAIGATLLWTGWFGFNGGSALAANRSAVHAVVNSQIGATTAACVYMAIVYFETKKPSTIAILNGAISGLAGVTPASGYISPPAAIVLGCILGATGYFGIWLLKHKLRIDDALDVSSVHGLTGIVGSLYIGIAADRTLYGGATDGLIPSGFTEWRLLLWQCIAVVVCGAWAGLWTFLILKGIGRFIPLRVTHEMEHHGLDHAIHAEVAVRHADSFVAPPSGMRRGSFHSTHGHGHGHGHGHARHRASTRASIVSHGGGGLREALLNDFGTMYDSSSSDDVLSIDPIRPAEDEGEAAVRALHRLADHLRHEQSEAPHSPHTPGHFAGFEFRDPSSEGTTLGASVPTPPPAGHHVVPMEGTIGDSPDHHVSQSLQ